MDLLAFKSTLIDLCRINPSKPVLLGFSGGPDSVCLLTLLLASGVPVIAAHLDHSLRPNSALESAQVEEICAKLGMRCVIKKANVREYALTRRISIEEAAREVRYEYLFTTAAAENAQAVLTGHHADDQVETVLMHLLRGSGLSGLAGMRMVSLPNPWSECIPLVRPMLSISKAEIDRHLQSVPIQPILDESNLDAGFFRNRIRHELLPILETYNPQFRERLSNTAEVVTLEDDFMLEMTEAAWKTALLESGSAYLVFDRKAITALSPAILRRLLRKALKTINASLRDIDFTLIARASNFCFSPSRTNHIDLAAGIEMFYYLKDRLVIALREDALHELWPQAAGDEDTPITLPGITRLNETWLFHSSVEDNYLKTDDAYIAQFDADKLPGSLLLSRFKPGERFSPFGAQSHTLKLGDFWTNQGLPARARGKWPLLRCGNMLAWVPGFRIAQDLRVSETTEKIIRVILCKAKPPH